jgi:hypothetical protein
MVESAISPENRDLTFPDRARKPGFRQGARAQKGNPAKRTGHALLVAAQYSQKSPENNGLLPGWLTDFRQTYVNFGGRLLIWPNPGLTPADHDRISAQFSPGCILSLAGRIRPRAH